MPAYNASKNIKAAIISVINQEYQEWELIIINDCSTDSTSKILGDFSRLDHRIKYQNLEENGGVANARNVGMSTATGRYIAFLDADDQWLPEKLNLQLSSLIGKEYFSIGSYYVINDIGDKTGKIVIPPTKVSYKSQLRGSKIGCLTVLVDRQVTGDFWMPVRGHEDYITWNDLLKKYGPAVSISTPIALYRSGNDSLSSNKLKAAKWQFLVYRDYYKFNIFLSAYYFFCYALNSKTKYKNS